jgi:formylglycine-generating enzyme required for sulfatase activity/uncharacterized caspase-like protein
VGKNWAITIGINGYRNLQRLSYAQRDAEAMRDYFRNEVQFEQVYHFSDDSPPIAQDYGEDIDSTPTYTTLSRFLHVRFEQPFLKAGDNLWFFFAGHGVRDEGRDYLMPIDAYLQDIQRSALSLYYITERLRRCGADNVVMLLDACRSEGRRDGLGIGTEVLGTEIQQGVITLFSCSPRQVSYEIDQLQQGAFTHTLLEALRIQGEGNCATVERLYQRLRDRLPQINQHFDKPVQVPYAVVEPASKYHLILLPRFATLRDAETLKLDAFRAEGTGDFELAEGFWIRVLMVSPADQDALDGIRRIDRLRHNPAPPTPPTRPFGGARSVSSGRFFLLISRLFSVPRVSTLRLSLPLSRRRLLQIASFSGAGLGTAFLGQALFRPTLESQTAKPLPSTSSASTNLKLEPFEFAMVTVDAIGQQNKPEQKQAQVFKEDLGSGVVLDMMMIPNGTFQMGSPETELERLGRERPQHSVAIQSFLMGKFQVTQAQWKAFAGLPKVKLDLKPDPSTFKGSDRPVENISWDDAVEFCDRLSKKTGRQYRLPSEAEWEYACRAETKTPFHFGETVTTDLANYRGRDWKSQGKTDAGNYSQGTKGVFREATTSVGSFKVANAFGLYDMHGNVWEWCADHWHENYQGAPTDGKAWLSEKNNQFRLIRGGSWFNNPRDCRSAYRNYFNPDVRLINIGFRVVCVLSRTL